MTTTIKTFIKLVPSDTAPLIGQRVSFTVTLWRYDAHAENHRAPLGGMPVGIWQVTDTGSLVSLVASGKTLSDGTFPWDGTSWESAGPRYYAAVFKGHKPYAGAFDLVKVDVSKKRWTTLTLTPSQQNPIINEQVTLTAKLTHYNPATHKFEALGGAPVYIWHYESGDGQEKVIDAEGPTLDDGTFPWETSWSAAGRWDYSATFDGDGVNPAATGITYVIVHASSETTLTLKPSKQKPIINEQVILTVRLKYFNPATHKFEALGGADVYIWHYTPADIKAEGPTLVDGTFPWETSWSAAGRWDYSATFDGDGVNPAATGITYVIVQKIPTGITMSATYVDDEYGQRVIVNGELKDVNGNPITHGPYESCVSLTSGNPNQGEIGVTTDGDGKFAAAMAVADPPNNWYKATFFGDQTYMGTSTTIWCTLP